MTMAPQLWPTGPQAVEQRFNKRHGPGTTLPNSFAWAVWTAEVSDYLEKLDAGHPGGDAHVPPTGTHPDLVDIAHVRWATGNAITAIDLCAATIGRLFCGNTGPHELSLARLRPEIQSPEARADALVCSDEMHPAAARRKPTARRKITQGVVAADVPQLGKRHTRRSALPRLAPCAKPV
ncbi:hypothetical protein [Mycobacterium sp. E2238]|uniref:hypothetical protein n=1 Tax=Mycobacterium sp. E2238 TaxID=1834131 RepID=UPI000A9C7138|nr:hypothetical protein [Mycobacterium sp. E2238]